MNGSVELPQQQQQLLSGVFPSSASGTNGFTPITSSRKSTAFDENNNNPSGAAGRSCFILPHLGTKKKKRTLRISSSAASTADQSSTAELFHLPEDDQQSLLNKNKQSNLNKQSQDSSPTSQAEWYMETLPEIEEDLEAQQQQQQQQPQSRRTIDDLVTDASFVNRKRGNKNKKSSISPRQVTPSSSSSNDPASPLLQPPTPQDRSHEARRMQTRESGQMHAYRGELEPEGVRGQEAAVLDTGTETGADSPDISLRAFDASQSIGRRVSQRQRELQSQLQDVDVQKDTTQRRQLQSSSGTALQAGTPRQIQQQQQYKPRRDSQSSTHRMQSPLSIQNGPTNRSSSASDRGNSSSVGPSDNYFSEVVKNNVAEIVQEQIPSHPLKQDVQSRSGVHGEGDHLHEPTYPTAHRTSYPHGSKSQQRLPVPATPTSTSKASSPIGSQRQSAPVNVDDSSFEDPNQHIQGIHAMAMEHVMRGEYDMALQAFTQVLHVYLQQHGRAHPLTASAYHNLGTVHTKRAGLLLDHTMHQRHCREQALLCFQAAARSARDSPQLGPNHPNVAVSLVRIGFLLLQSRQYQNAVITFEEALRIRLDHYGPTHSLVANLYNNQGVCHMHLQNFSQGRRYLQQALDIQKELLNQEEYSTTSLLELADTLCNIGGLNLEWIRQQGPDARHALDAESSFLEALEIRAKVLGEQHPLTNQVRSLHDMVRSIPLPKSMGSSRMGDAPSQSLPQEFSPAGMSEMTVRSVASSTPSRSAQKDNNVEPPHTPSTKASDDLNLPSLNRSPTTIPGRSPQSVPKPLSPSRMVRPATPDQTRSGISPLERSKTSYVADYDATEECCLLRRPTDDDVSASNVSSIVVTYAQSITSANNSRSNRETDRLATMRHAKAVLDAHRDFLDSPGTTAPGIPSVGTNTRTKVLDETVNEDGLVPLGGNWPDPVYDIISPEVLQDPQRHLQTIHDCAVSYTQKGLNTEAGHLFEMVVEVQKSKNGTVHEDVGCALHNVGMVYLRKKEYYHALQAFEEAVRVRKGALGRDHPQVAVSLVKVGISLLLLRRLQDSLWILREALSVRKLALGSLHPSNARIYNNIGCCHVEFDELNEGRRSFEAALDIQRNALVNDPDNGQVMFGASTTLQNLGYLYAKRDMHEKAATVLRESLGVSEMYRYLFLSPNVLTFYGVLLLVPAARKNHGGRSPYCTSNATEPRRSLLGCSTLLSCSQIL
jgi:tetratricopeptide (TPR) repeat protein